MASVESLCHRDVLDLDQLGLFSVSQEYCSDKIPDDMHHEEVVLTQTKAGVVIHLLCIEL